MVMVTVATTTNLCRNGSFCGICSKWTAEIEESEELPAILVIFRNILLNKTPHTGALCVPCPALLHSLHWHHVTQGDVPMSEMPNVVMTSAQAEYMSLREEVLKRIESRQQTISIALTLAGAFLGLGWNAGAVVILIYPLIALLLAVGWAQNEVFIKQINAYIRDTLENQVSGLGWQRYSQQRMSELKVLGWPLEVLAIGGIFALTQIMAVALGGFRFGNSPVEWLLMLLDIAAIALLLALLNYVRQRSLI
jgi:hypothetical protein